MFPNLVTYHIHREPSLPPNGDPAPSSERGLAYQYILAGNGVFVRAETKFFNAQLRIAPGVVRGLPPLAAAFRLKVARVPARLLARVLADARQARRGDGGLNEVLYQFHHHGQMV